MPSIKDQLLRDALHKWPGVGVTVALVVAALWGYDYFKYFFWPQADAVVEMIEPTCNYYKSRWFMRGGDGENIDCEAKDEAEKLIADGYEFTGNGQTIRVVYESEPGRKT